MFNNSFDYSPSPYLRRRDRHGPQFVNRVEPHADDPHLFDGLPGPGVHHHHSGLQGGQVTGEMDELVQPDHDDNGLGRVLEFTTALEGVAGISPIVDAV